MEGFRFSDFKGTGSARATPRGEWLSESGSLYPTLDIANLVDVISDNIRAKAATMTGYKDPDAQVPALMRLFRLNGSTGPTLTFEEFVNTLSKMNVIGLQHGVSALFDRYDFEGTGTIVTEQFVTMLLRCVPDCNGALELRNSFATIRRACRAAGGLHGLRRLVQSLERRSRSGLLRRGDLGEALVELGAYVKDGDIRPVLVAYDSSGAGAISLPELVFGLRGCLPRPRRLLVERTWQALLRRAGLPVTGSLSGAIDIDTLAAHVDTSCALFTTPPALHATSARSATARLAASARGGATSSGRPGTAAPSSADFDLGLGGGDETDIYAAFGNAPEVSAAGFLAYMQDVSPLLPRDTEFIKLLNDAFGVDAHMDRSALVKPGSVEDLLRSGRGAHGIPEYTAVGRMPTPGLLGGKPGVPGLGGVAGHAVAGTPAAAGGYGADSRYGLHSSARLAASLGGRVVAADPAAAAAAAAAATGGAATSASGAAGLGITGGYAGASVPLPGHSGHGLGHSQRAASAAPAASSPYASYGHGHGSHGFGFGASDGPSAGAPVARHDGGATALAAYAAAARAKAASGVRPSTAMPALGSPRMHLSLGLGGSSAGASKAHSPASSYGGGAASDHGHGLYGSGFGSGAAAMPTIGEGSPASTAGSGAGAGVGWPGHGLAHSGGGHASHGARPMTAAPAFGRGGGFGASGSAGFGAAAASSGGGFGVVGQSFAGTAGGGSSSSGGGSARMGVREAPAALGSGGGGGPSGEPVAQSYSPAGALSGLAIGNSSAGGFGASGSPAGGATAKMRPHTAGPRIVLAPQLARSLGRATLRF